MSVTPPFGWPTSSDTCPFDLRRGTSALGGQLFGDAHVPIFGDALEDLNFGGVRRDGINILLVLCMCCCAILVPSAPIDAPKIPAGFPFHALCPYGPSSFNHFGNDENFNCELVSCTRCARLSRCRRR